MVIDYMEPDLEQSSVQITHQGQLLTDASIGSALHALTCQVSVFLFAQ